MEIDFRKARPGEEQQVYSMIAQRIAWMDEKGIHQWNETDYLTVYPLEYYTRNLDKLYLLAERETEKILCAAILFAQDERWNRQEPSFYIHHLVSARNAHGAGAVFMQKAEELAAEKDISYLRLDSAVGNEKLAAFYEKLGFVPCGECHDGNYHGILRQKKVL